jgi:Helix-turn-helix domain
MDESGLTPKQMAASRCLIAGMNQVETAKEVGVDRDTIRRWMRSEVFTDYLKSVNREVLLGVVAALGGHAGTAVGVLAELMKTSTDERLRATCAKTLLAFLPTFGDHVYTALDNDVILAEIDRLKSEAQK